MEQIQFIGIVIIVVLISVILHELAHGVVAYWLGDSTAKDEGRLSLNPFVHLDWFMSLILPVMLAITGGPIFGGAKPVPINTSRLKYGEWGFALVAIAGPLTNLILAFIGFMIGHFTGIIYGDGLWAMVVLQFVLVNLGFMVFNLIPIPPLDGSRVLYALAPDFAREFMMKIERYGIFIVLGLVMIFGAMFSNIMLEGIFGVLRFFEWLVA